MLGGCGSSADSSRFTVGVFVPGVVEGSPTYEMMVNGVRQAVQDAGLPTVGDSSAVTVYEAGFNQGEWLQGLLGMAESGGFSLIVTTNPSMPDLILEAQKAFPEQKYLVLDAYLAGNPHVKTVYFNQYEQAYLAGWLAAKISTSTELTGANPQKRVGIVAGQEYPVMNRHIVTGYTAGARAVDPDFEVDFRVLGNWWDAALAADLVRSQVGNGVDVVLTIAGGGNQGTISAARETGTYIIHYDSPGYAYGPGTVLGSTVVNQEAYSREAVLKAIQGQLDYGIPETLGVREGGVFFDFESPEYSQYLPESIRRDFEAFYQDLRSGAKTIQTPVIF